MPVAELEPVLVCEEEVVPELELEPVPVPVLELLAVLVCEAEAVLVIELEPELD